MQNRLVVFEDRERVKVLVELYMMMHVRPQQLGKDDGLDAWRDLAVLLESFSPVSSLSMVTHTDPG